MKDLSILGVCRTEARKETASKGKGVEKNSCFISWDPKRGEGLLFLELWGNTLQLEKVVGKLYSREKGRNT